MAISTNSVRAGVIAAAALGAASTGAFAQRADAPQTQRGFYIGGGVGANFQEQNRFRGGGADSNAGYEPGYLGLLDFGYAMGNGLRLELEPSWRHNDVDKIGGISGHGGSDIGAVMVNGIYDLNYPIPFLRGWEPHLGLGVGAARVHNHSAGHNTLLVSGSDTVPAFQGIAGIDYAVTPAMRVGVDYRYFLAHDANFHVDSTGASVKGGDYNDHSILLTFRYQFGAPERPKPEPAAVMTPVPQEAQPATPATPPPPARRDYTVYFDLNRATLTAAGREVVRRAAQAAKQGEATRLDVTGYTDTTGTARYNQRLSERRAAAVRAELVADGVTPDEITTKGRGESDLAVPTAAGVKEPRNRRVLIVVEQPGS
jgi:OmpA-OmpF porin, OOP family